MSKYHSETQEEIAKVMTTAGCKSCGSTGTSQGWWDCEGDVYCWTCALMIDEMDGTTVEWVETEAQIITRMEWDLMGAGTN